ncbi:hypothetical protein [Dictyobacter aurantiacus]|uniref:Uncharacterized protein n=1 Tax=Dictyobacter aurantiacus TaxID=1936993 RepID=A0A401ZQK3_9CHLR|nr:hypothetical protein [Dictyobacter aurantiacus]GCE09188.1 hypothetical protein KDAU_65170 [Dictyobacter aurantiacus]
MVYIEKRCRVCNAVITWEQSDTACKMHCRDRLYTESYRIERHKEKSYRKNHPCRQQIGE